MYVVYGVTIICLIIVMMIWIWTQDPIQVISWWNRRLKPECDEQDAHSLNGIPSYHNAWNHSNKTVQQFNHLVHVHRDEILREFQGETQSIWIRYMGEWSAEAIKIPTLKKIASLFPDIPNLGITIFQPGTTLINQSESSQIFHKYHYGLKVENNDIGLKIANFDVKWEQHEGFTWDSTLSHSIWNHTLEPRIIIFADVFRNFSLINSLGSHRIYSMFQYIPEIIQKKTELQEESVLIK